jgi:hypothetical protein
LVSYAYNQWTIIKNYRDLSMSIAKDNTVVFHINGQGNVTGSYVLVDIDVIQHVITEWKAMYNGEE